MKEVNKLLEEMHKNFPVMVIDRELDSEEIGGRAIREIVEHLEELEYRVIKANTLEDARLAYLSHEDTGSILLSWEMKGEGEIRTPVDFVKFVRRRNKRIPIFIMTEKMRIGDIPLEIVETVDGYIWKEEDTPAFIAGRVKEAMEKYISSLLPPFFGELARYVELYRYAWHTPGHMGGIAFRKSPVGRIFFDFFGENTFRADLSVSVPELGSLMEHSGVVGDAENEAAKIFNSDRTFFVTNGTSTANRIVFNGCLRPGDVVLVDRNCHKSVMYAIILSGAIPVYLIPTRNQYGIIGPIHVNEFDPKTIRRKIEENPLTKTLEEKRIKLAVVTNSTYDGLCYNVEMIKNKLSSMVKCLHFDEAWYGYAHFHPLYRGRYAMSEGNEKEEHPIIFATQSTHKVLAAFSQGSMIHIKQRHKKEEERIDYERFNEAFMMHTSTSPQYEIIASLDIGAKMMEGELGKSLINDALEEAIIFRWKMSHIEEELLEENPEGEWWFKVWQPEHLEWSPEEHLKALNSPPDSKLFKEFVERITLKPNDEWHGFEGLVDDYIMLDPLKVTILTPGITKDGKMDEWGIPASIVSAFLRNEGIVVEKTGFYSFLILFTIGITKGKSGSILSALFRFKEMYDRNAPLNEVFPELVNKYPYVYENMGLKDLCNEMHRYIKERGITTEFKDVYANLPDVEMSPSEAYYRMVDGKVKKVAVKNLIGKIAAVMVVPYPPGIPIIMPGEKITKETKSIRDYLLTYQEFDNRFPGFETEFHGVIVERENGKVRYYIYCVDSEGS